MAISEYDYWYSELNEKFARTWGVMLDDVEDFPFRDWFADDLSTSEALELINERLEADL